jgi:microcystin synthetase protein McyJ
MSHEARVERFYAHGVEKYGTHHDNYLNFGLWADGVREYTRAVEALLERVGTEIGLGPEAVVLDVACGMGAQDRFFERRFGCAAIEAVDLARKHIEIAVARHSLPQVTYRVGNACRLPFADATFTHATAIEGIIHFNTRADFFREARRLLRPGGRLGVADFFMRREPRSAIERTLLRWGAAMWHVPAANLSTLAAYRGTLEGAGFTDIATDDVSDHVIPGYVFEQCRPEVRRQVRAIRGQILGRVGVVIDIVMYKLYRLGIVGYVVVSARKPHA